MKIDLFYIAVQLHAIAKCLPMGEVDLYLSDDNKEITAGVVFWRDNERHNCCSYISIDRIKQAESQRDCIDYHLAEIKNGLKIFKHVPDETLSKLR